MYHVQFKRPNASFVIDSSFYDLDKAEAYYETICADSSMNECALRVIDDTDTLTRDE